MLFQMFFVLDINKAIDSIINDPKTDFTKLSTQTSNSIVQGLLERLHNEKKHSTETLSSSNTFQLVARALYDKVQHVIDLYLSGDDAELEKRRYYSQVAKPYDRMVYLIRL